MQAKWIMAAVPAALVALSATAQDTATGAARPLRPVTEIQSAPGGAARAQDFDAVAWKERLLDPDLDRRLAAFEDWSSRLAGHREAKQQLAQWIEDGGDLTWTARLLQRECELPKDPFAQLRADFQGLSGGLLQGSLGQGIFGQGDPFGGFLQGGGLDAWIDGQASTTQNSVSLSETPDGIRVEVTENEDGNSKTQVYEAADREELLRLYPELRQHLEGQSLFSVSYPYGFLRGSRGVWPPIAPSPLHPSRSRGQLGVYLEPSLKGESNLVVRSVVPGSLAESLGVQAGDELVELNKRRLVTVEDIAAVLRERKPQEALHLTVLRPDGELRELSYSGE